MSRGATPRSICGVCSRTVALTNNGQFRLHAGVTTRRWWTGTRWVTPPCEGSRTPADQLEVVATELAFNGGD